MPLILFLLILPLTSCKTPFFCKFPSQLFLPQYFIWMYITHHWVFQFTIYSTKDGSSWDRKYLEKYGAFLNSFSLEVKRLIQSVEQIKDKIDGLEVSVQFDQKYIYICTHTHTCIYALIHTHTHTHTYIYMYACVLRDVKFSTD